MAEIELSIIEKVGDISNIQKLVDSDLRHVADLFSLLIKIDQRINSSKKETKDETQNN